MFKTWQIFVFSLIPLALVFAGVFIGSIHGSDSELEVFPTPAPAATPRSLAAPGDGDVRLTVRHLSSQRAPSMLWSPVLSPTTTELVARVSPSVAGPMARLLSQNALAS